MPQEHVRILDDIRTVAPAAWDALTTPEDSPFVQHAWLASLEEAGCVRPEVGWLPHHITIWKGDTLIAAAPAYLKGNSEGEFVFDYAWARAAEQLGLEYYPKLIVAIPFTPATGGRLLVAPDHDRNHYATVLVNAIRAIAEQLEVSSAHVLFANERDQKVLEGAGFAMRLGVQFHWCNQNYGTYDDFLASFNAKRRHQLRRERREVLDQGIETKTLRGSEITDEALGAMYRFYTSTAEKFFPYARVYLNSIFFDLIRSKMSSDLELVIAYENAKPIAGALNVSGGGRLYGRYWGCDAERPFLHFHVCYYHSIEDCILRGLHAFEPGAGGEHKLPRGFHPALTYSAHHLVDPQLDHAVRNHLHYERAAVLKIA